VRPKGLSLKNPSDPIEKRTRDLPALSTVPHPVQWVPGYFPGVKQPGRNVDHSCPSSGAPALLPHTPSWQALGHHYLFFLK